MIKGSNGKPAPKVKVKQDTIDLIKAMGMKAALKKVSTSPSFKAGTDSAAAFKEGVRRMYGETRYQNALYTPKASPGPAFATGSRPASKIERLKNPANR
jgi:hypothetical protein